MDFSKAFDKVNYQLLVYNWVKLRIDKILFWIKSFLCNGTQTVVVEGKQSDT